jgi:hypothetical protein
MASPAYVQLPVGARRRCFGSLPVIVSLSVASIAGRRARLRPQHLVTCAGRGGGLDYRFLRGVLSLDLRYNLGLVTLDDSGDGEDVKNRAFMFTIGFGIPWRRALSTLHVPPVALRPAGPLVPPPATSWACGEIRRRRV